MRFTRMIPIASEYDWRKTCFTPTISSIINKAQYGLDKLLRQGRKKSY